MALTTVAVALDWTPNTNHLPFYVAKKEGLFAERGLDVRLISTTDAVYHASYGKAEEGEEVPPPADEPYVTPCGLVASGRATFALNSPEGVLNWNCSPGKPALKAVAAVLQRNTSAVVTTKPSGLTRPKDLDGKVYASYAARFEGRIVQALIRADGGQGDFVEKTPPMLGIWNTVLSGAMDATWIFLGWEGVEAKLKGVELNEFALEDYGIPYGYAPCLVAHPSTLEKEGETVKAFLAAAAEGAKRAAADPAAAAAALVELAKQESGVDVPAELATESAKYLADKWLPEGGGSWGRMLPKRWDDYLDWLDKEGLLTQAHNSRKPDAAKGTASLDDLRQGNAGEKIARDSIPTLFTNDFLP